MDNIKKVLFRLSIFIVLGCVFVYSPPIFAKSGCCSWHGGVSGCDTSVGRQICNDGTYSPSCTCYQAPIVKKSTPRPTPVYKPSATPVPTQVPPPTVSPETATVPTIVVSPAIPPIENKATNNSSASSTTVVGGTALIMGIVYFLSKKIKK